jgi:predicted ATPase
LQRDDVRLLTLTGPGGVGKTRLAARVAADCGDFFAGGAVFVALASIAEPGLVIATMAHRLGLGDGDGRPLQVALREHLRMQHLLLVLDNFEQVLAAAPALADLLGACPGLKLLVTSRAALHLQGEHEYPVPPLELPASEQLPAAEQLAQYAAVALFVQRARAVNPGFSLTTQNAPVVAAICRRLDGLPLAIEIAVARIKVLPPQALLARLTPESGHSLLHLLTGGAQDLPARQQTVRNAVAWSYDLLDAAEQTLFRRLAIFAGGWTLEGAEAVCALPGSPDLAVLDELSSLEGKSLVEYVELAPGQARFRYLEVIREYALERLEASGETATLRVRHAACYRALAQEVEPALKGPDQADALARLDQEQDNLRAALRWACAGGDLEIGLQTAGALRRMWEIRGYLSEGRQWFAELLARAERGEAQVAGSTRALAVYGAGTLAYRQSDYAQASILLEESLALWRALADTRGVAAALNDLGNVAMSSGDHERARLLYLQSLDLRRELADPWGIGSVLNNLAIVAEEQHDYARAVAWYEESIAIRRELGDTSAIASGLGNLGAAAMDHGDYERAAACFKEGLALQRALGDRRGTAVLLNHFGALTFLQGRYEEAAVLLREGLVLSREIGDKLRIAALIETLGTVAYEQQQPHHAARLYGASEALRTASLAVLSSSDQANHDRDVAMLRTALGDEAMRANWMVGASWSLEQAIAEALA